MSGIGRAAGDAIAILHAGPEWCEQELARAFARLGRAALLLHVADVDAAAIDRLASAELVLNRVYASTADASWPHLRRAIAITGELDARGANLVNSHAATLAEYSKHEAYLRMAAAEVATPLTVLVSSLDEVEPALARVGLPAVLKRDTGGRAADLARLVSRDGALAEVKRRLAGDEPYYRGGGRLVLQPLLVATADHDLRLGLLDQAPFACYGRRYIALGDEPPWVGSVARGSAQVRCDAAADELHLAWCASAAIGARWNELDLCRTSAGPFVVENNPVPGYEIGATRLLARLAAALVEPLPGLV